MRLVHNKPIYLFKYVRWELGLNEKRDAKIQKCSPNEFLVVASAMQKSAMQKYMMVMPRVAKYFHFSSKIKKEQ